MRLRDENEALMETLVRTKVELAETQGALAGCPASAVYLYLTAPVLLLRLDLAVCPFCILLVCCDLLSYCTSAALSLDLALCPFYILLVSHQRVASSVP